jgi:molybdopterin synthase catalytic subunit
MPNVIVRFFGPAVDLAATSERRYSIDPNSSLGTLAGRLASDFPKLGTALGVRLAVNHRFVPLNQVLADGDEVAVIPPVSGG